MKRILCALPVLALMSTAAAADVPAFVDGPVFAKVCERLEARYSCAECACSAITSSAPIDVGEGATDYPSAVLVEVSGKTDEGVVVKMVHAVLGSAKKLVDAGPILDLTTHMGRDQLKDYTVDDSRQFYDMCPGMCEHMPVGLAHLFQLTATTDTNDEGGPSRQQQSVTTLVSCFELDGAPVCYGTPVGAASVSYEQPEGASKPKKPAARGWRRSWKLGGEAGMQLVFGPITGPKAAAAKKEAVGKAPKASYLFELGKRPDTVKMTP